MGLGKKGTNRLQAPPTTADELFKPTENIPANDLREDEETARGRPKGDATVPKRFQFSKELNQRLRKYCFENECSEVDVVRKALDNYLKSNTY
jgi:hypothetical protein